MWNPDRICFLSEARRKRKNTDHGGYSVRIDPHTAVDVYKPLEYASQNGSDYFELLCSVRNLLLW
jgi:hypothetical protein